MLRRLIRTLAIAAPLAALAAGCGGTTTEQGIGPTAPRCQLAVTAPPPMLPPEATSVTLSVTTARDCMWTASTQASWVQVSPTTGQGEGPVTVAVAENPQGRPRSASVVINETPVTVNQDGAPCRFELGSRQAGMGHEGGRTSIRVSAADGCEWQASAGASWVRVLTERGTGAGTVDLEVSANEGSERSATVSIAGLAFLVIQEAFSAVPTPPAVCTFAIDPDRLSFRSSGGPGSIRVLTEPGCSWNAAAQASWISVSRTGGTGPETLHYQVAAHTSTTSDRAGSLVVAGRTHSVTQQACPLSLDPGSQSFGSPGGEGLIRVITEPGCSWTASAGAGWISLSRSSGTGADTLRYQVAVYDTTAFDRAAAVLVSGRSHTVRQAAYRAEEVSAEGILSNVSGGCPAFTFSVGGRLFVTDHRTAFDTTCDKIRNGARAFVRGTLLPDGRVLATRVDIDD